MQAVAVLITISSHLFPLELNAESRSTIRFAAMGDTQISVGISGCAKNSHWQGDQTLNVIRALNGYHNRDSVTWPDTGFGDAGEFLRKGRGFLTPHAVIIAGDLQENASQHSSASDCNEWGVFSSLFPAAGDPTNPSNINYPVFETTGNHDFSLVENKYEAIDEAQRKKTPKKIQERHSKRKGMNGDAISNLHFQNKNRGSYRWQFEDIHFVNLGVKPSGGGGLHCHKETNFAHGYETPLTDKKCWEWVRKTKNNKEYFRLIDPHYALGFLKNAKIYNTQVVLTTHYGPKNQSRLANDELQNLCDILIEKRLRVIAWIVGHTHKSDYYEWTCGMYNVPVFNVGSGFTGQIGNANEFHFGVFRISQKWLEAVDIGYSAESGFANRYHVPGTQALNSTDCRSAKGYNRDWDDSGRHTPFGVKLTADFDEPNPPDTQAKWCNPDGNWGGWQVRVPICPKGSAPYLPLTKTSKELRINSECNWATHP